MRKRTLTLIAMVGAAAWLLGIAPPTARADALPNGYDVTCTQNGNDVICNISGCPRVKDDEAGDAVHLLTNGQGQQELKKDCNGTAIGTIAGFGASPFTLGVQGCRKHPVGSDDCGPWSDYKYTPPAKAAAPAAEPVLCTAGPDAGKKLPPGSTCSSAPAAQAQAAPVQCPAGSVEPTVPAGGVCSPPDHDVAMTITQSGLNATVDITNNSSLPADCTYTATKTAGLGPQTVTRTIAVGPKSTGAITDMLWPPPLTTYDAVAICTITYLGSPWPVGKASQTVTG